MTVRKVCLKLCALVSTIALSCLLAGPVASQESGPLVLTSLQSTYSLTSALAEGTNIRVENAPSDGARMAGQERVLFDPDLDELFASADAVVTIARVWRDDQLYQAARARNIRVVPIDAARPWDEAAAPVGLRKVPCSNVSWASGEPCVDEISPFVWLSIANGIRMAENIAVDLERLAPDDTTQIQMNLGTLVAELRTLKSEYDNKFAFLPDIRVFALAEEFVYLFGEMGVFVDGYFIQEDVRWTDEDIRAFENYLVNDGPNFVVHKWEPSQPISDAIDRAGVRLIILDSADPGLEVDDHLDLDGYLTILDSDLNALLAAFAPG